MKNKRSDTLKRISLLIIILLIVTLLSTVVLADLKSSVTSGVGSVKSKLGNLFDFNADKPSFLDFTIFFVIFMSLSWLGFSQWFQQQQGSSKGAIVGLSVGIAIAFSAALVYGAKFGIAKLLPFAVIFIGIALFILLYALMSKILNADSTGKKVLAAIIALILTIVVVLVGVSILEKEGVCDRNRVLKKICGSESVFSRPAGGAGKSAVTPVTPTPQKLNGTSPAPDQGQTGTNTTTAESKIPKNIQDQMTALKKEVDATEGRLDRAIADKDADAIMIAKNELTGYKIRIGQIISSLATIK